MEQASNFGDSPSAQAKPVDAPLLLLGTTRAGTTLLSLMLGHHRDMVFVSELEWIWDGPGVVADREPDPRTYFAWLTTHRLFQLQQLELSPTLAFRDLPRDLFEQLRRKHDPGLTKRYVGCQVHNYYEEARRTWPNARFIHIVRDGRDVCASWIKLGWLGNGYEAGLRWRSMLEEWERACALIPEEQRMELRFETLLRDPEPELRRLCAFVGVPYDPNMLRYHEDTTYGPIDPSQAGKWAKQLTRRDVRLFEAVAGRELEQQGYPLSGEPALKIRPWSRPLIAFEDNLKHHRARARIYGPSLWLADIAARRLRIPELRDRVRLRMNDVDNALLQ